MMNYLVRESYKNMTVDTVEVNGLYIVRAFVNGKLHDSYETADIADAQQVYGDTVYAMYK